MHPLRIERLVHRWPSAERTTLGIGALSLASGESLFLYGPSGCAISTLLSEIAGVVGVPSGVVRLATRISVACAVIRGTGGLLFPAIGVSRMTLADGLSVRL
jgi:ABC-type taurine transport system ATPase subunit